MYCLFLFKLKYTWFIILRSFQVFSTVIQNVGSIYSIIGYYKIIVIIPCVIHYILAAYLFYIELFISVNPITLICSSPLVTINLLSISVRQNRLAFKFSFEEWFLLLDKQKPLKTSGCLFFFLFCFFFFLLSCHFLTAIVGLKSLWICHHIFVLSFEWCQLSYLWETRVNHSG